jgi:anti-sigma B factor antagonist/stage II sporulation protein AA (anti-sigma F factor antagonist)
MDPPIRRRPFDEVPMFDAFISYSSRDGKLVEQLAGRLAGHGLDVFFDLWYIGPGQHVTKSVLAALRKSRKLVACMTPHYFQSRWAEFELNWNFVETHLLPAGTQTPVIPVMLRPCEIPKEIEALRRIDLSRDDGGRGFDELAAALSRAESLVIGSPILSPGSGGRSFREFVVDKLKLFFHFPDARLRNFETVYGELVDNAFEHVRKKSNAVEVRVTAFAGHIVLEVSDSGPGFDLPARLQLERQAVARDPSAVGPRGLHLVDAICDRLGNEVKHRRHVITAVLYRERLTGGAGVSVGPRRFGEVVVLSPGGRIDQSVADAFKAALAPHLERCVRGLDRLVLDLSAVENISSAGLRVLMLAIKQAKAQGGTLVVAGLQPVVRQIFEISRFGSVVEVFPSVREALAKIDPAALRAWDDAAPARHPGGA